MDACWPAPGDKQADLTQLNWIRVCVGVMLPRFDPVSGAGSTKAWAWNPKHKASQDKCLMSADTTRSEGFGASMVSHNGSGSAGYLLMRSC